MLRRSSHEVGGLKQIVTVPCTVSVFGSAFITTSGLNHTRSTAIRQLTLLSALTASPMANYNCSLSAVVKSQSEQTAQITKGAAIRYIDGLGACCAFNLPHLRHHQPLINQRIWHTHTQRCQSCGEKLQRRSTFNRLYTRTQLFNMDL